MGTNKTACGKSGGGGVERYPVGSIYLSVNNENPSKYFGGEWARWGYGKVPVGVDESQEEFDTAQKTGGEKTHTLTANEMPSHNHEFGLSFVKRAAGDLDTVTAGSTSRYNTDSTGGGRPHNNLPPYITCYMWRRTA